MKISPLIRPFKIIEISQTYMVNGEGRTCYLGWLRYNNMEEYRKILDKKWKNGFRIIYKYASLVKQHERYNHVELLLFTKTEMNED